MQRGRRRPPRFEVDWRAGGRPPRSGGGVCGRATNVCLSVGRSVGGLVGGPLSLSPRSLAALLEGKLLSCSLFLPPPSSFLPLEETTEGGRRSQGHGESGLSGIESGTWWDQLAFGMNSGEHGYSRWAYLHSRWTWCHERAWGSRGRRRRVQSESTGPGPGARPQ